MRSVFQMRLSFMVECSGFISSSSVSHGFCSPWAPGALYRLTQPRCLQSLYCPVQSGAIQQRLTDTLSKAILYLLSQKTKVGIETPGTSAEKAALLIAVFLCLPKNNTGLIRIKFIMVGCNGQPQGWPVPEAGSLNPEQPATQRLRPKGGGLKPTSGVTAMRQYAQNPAENSQQTQSFVSGLNPVQQQFTSVFNLVENNTLLFSDLTFYEALALLICHPNALIKFDRMEVLQ